MRKSGNILEYSLAFFLGMGSALSRRVWSVCTATIRLRVSTLAQGKRAGPIK